MAEDNQKTYEISYLLKTEGDKEAILKALNSVKAQISFESELKMIALAYKIKKESQAFLGWIKFTANPEEIIIVRDYLKTAPVIRFLIIESGSRKTNGAPREFYRGRKPTVPAVEPKERQSNLSNEALEQKLKEILQ